MNKDDTMKLPQPRGPLSDGVLDHLRSGARAGVGMLELVTDSAVRSSATIFGDEDVQLAAYVLYELAYRGFDGVDDDAEWDLDLLRIRLVLARAFEDQLRQVVEVPAVEPGRSTVAQALFAMTIPSAGPSVARFVSRRASRDQLREFLVLRSIYQLKEADPHTWAIPRLSGAPKAALVEIQADEYGGGDGARMHSELFARTMRGAGLDDTYGAYIEHAPAATLATVNLMSLFGMHRRLRGAIVGHLAAFEMTSSLPNRLYGDGFRRHGFDAATTEYFDEHVEADAVHEQIAARDLAGGLSAMEPELTEDIVFGAASCLYLDDLAGTEILEAWDRDESALRSPR